MRYDPQLKFLRRTAHRGFTLVEVMVAAALLGFALIVMFGLHAQAVRSNMHAKRMTDCTYLAQAQMEQLLSLRWTSQSRPAVLTDNSTDATSAAAPWAYLEHPNSGAAPRLKTATNNAVANYASGPRMYAVTWDVEDMDTSATWMRIRVRCSYLDRAFNQSKGTTISSYRFRDG